MKTKLIMGCILTSMVIDVNAQLTSYDVNNTPINGSANAAFGVSALSDPAPGTGNVALGIQSLRFNQADWNTAGGYNSLYTNKTGENNAAFGTAACGLSIGGSNNTAIGAWSLRYNLESDNTAVGYNSLGNNSNGKRNIAIGVGAAYNNGNASENIAIGYNALPVNGLGGYNIAIGRDALMNCTSTQNIGIGNGSLHDETSGTENTAVGIAALLLQQADQNTAFGYYCMSQNTYGGLNCGFGEYALPSNTTGDHNCAFGVIAGAYNSTGSYNSFFGYGATPATGALTNCGAFGYNASVSASNEIFVGNTSLLAVRSQNGVFTSSDGRFKTNIDDKAVKGLDFIMKLRPVEYNFKTKALTEHMVANLPDSLKKSYLSTDFTVSESIRHSGFIAQEVEQAAKSIGYNFDGVLPPQNEADHYSVNYAAFVVPLVKATQEQQAMIEEQKKQIDQQNAIISDLAERLNTLQDQALKVTGIDETNVSINGFSMGQNIPNPFSKETTISYSLPQTVGSAYLAVYDLTGKQLLKIDLPSRGSSKISLSSDKLTAGIYNYSIVADGKSLGVKRMIIADK